jgi:hypothetical protein
MSFEERKQPKKSKIKTKKKKKKKKPRPPPPPLAATNKTDLHKGSRKDALAVLVVLPAVAQEPLRVGPLGQHNNLACGKREVCLNFAVVFIERHGVWCMKDNGLDTCSGKQPLVLAGAASHPVFIDTVEHNDHCACVRKGP